ncbi:MAG: UbiA family prenyltransferase [Actinobacteria bacterium]|nr:UbiA family prenyltransferase [Actinomycetota bacterium]
MRENLGMHLLRTSHFGPTMAVTLIAFLLAQALWPVETSALIAITIFTGQLCVGWTNDLVDSELDRSQGRRNKPLAQGLIVKETVIYATYTTLAICVGLSLFGPLGLRGGLVHLLGVGCGVTYNFYFKRNVFSPLPYAIAFAGLPTSIALSKGIFPPLWLALAGGLLGISAHFTNVVKDIDEDRLAGIYGLPQLLGARNSQIIGGCGFVLVALLLQVVTQVKFLLPLGLLSLALLFFIPKKYAFVLSMLLAILDVSILVRYGAESFSQRS